MDRLKEIGSSAREKAGLAPKKSYHNYSDSRISTAKTHPDTLSKIKGLVPDRVVRTPSETILPGIFGLRAF